MTYIYSTLLGFIVLLLSVIAALGAYYIGYKIAEWEECFAMRHPTYINVTGILAHMLIYICIAGVSYMFGTVLVHGGK